MRNDLVQLSLGSTEMTHENIAWILVLEINVVVVMQYDSREWRAVEEEIKLVMIRQLVWLQVQDEAKVESWFENSHYLEIGIVANSMNRVNGNLDAKRENMCHNLVKRLFRSELSYRPVEFRYQQ